MCATRRESARSLRYKLLLVVLVAFIPAVAVTVYVGLNHREHETREAEEAALAVVRHSTESLGDIINRRTPPLLRLLAATTPEITTGDSAQCSAAFTALLAQYPEYHNIMAASIPDGKVFASGVPLAKPTSLADRAYFQTILKTNDFAVGGFAIGKVTGKPTLTCGIPVPDSSGETKAVLVAGVNVELLAKRAATAARKDMTIFLIDRDGQILLATRGNDSWAGKKITGSSLWKEVRRGGREGIFKGEGIGGVPVVAAYRQLSEENDGYVIGSINQSEIGTEVHHLEGNYAAGIAATLLLALFGLLYVGTRSIHANIRRLVEAAERVTAGDFVTCAKNYGDIREFNTLAQAFEIMSQKLLEREQARVAAEKALLAEKERLLVTLRSIGDGVITTDAEARVVMLNPMAESLTGWSQDEATGRPLAEVFHIINEKSRQHCENPAEKVLRTGAIIELANHTALVHRDGKEFIIADSGAPIRDGQGKIIGVVLVFRDITEKQALEDELIKTEKLESLSLLAGGIAHDFNNLLTVILGNISLARLHAGNKEASPDKLDKAERATMRARDLTTQLLSFTRGGPLVKRVVPISELIRETAGFALSGSNVRCHFEIAENLWPVEIDPGQFSQVIHNLVLNALQAMPDGGNLVITAANIPCGSSIPLAKTSSSCVRIDVHDEGSGIPPENVGRIFDPYFTTKVAGTGLGLASCYYIIQRHDGHIQVNSSAKGSTFTIYLPASLGQVTKTQQLNHNARCSGRVLLMDDEAPIREVGREMLLAMGYIVDVAMDGEEAVQKYRAALAAGEPYGAVIMDLTIPGGVGGVEALLRLQELDPSVAAIASSGYSTDPVMADYRKYGFQGILPKPYIFQEMQAAVTDVITSRDTGRRG